MNTTGNSQQSAKIYQFPIRNRATEAGQRKAVELATSHVAYAECGSSWYHDAAIQEATAQNHREH